MSRSIIIIAHNLRSSHNVGSLLRTADGLGVDTVYLTGYTPYPAQADDERLPHITHKLDRQIHKTALGAEVSQKWLQADLIEPVVNQLKQQGYSVVALEQTPTAISLPDYQPADKLVLIVGREVEGIEAEVLALTEQQLQIPMLGQ
ncbi:MAG: TrmH family RNA methyltransferase, partial [Candidatus Saccharimonadales bacterium]